ncbi:MAG TPA: VWA domain-containing protein [Vicinamibacterales bacterium]|nr:VWA domain-containing protein [Vicinamibacterales bacterium]
MRRIPCVVIVTALLASVHPSAQEAAAIFRSGVERVAIAAVVRDSKGRHVTGLEARDFELLDDGRARPLIGAWSESSPASVAILMDASGSMATKMARAKETAQLLVTGLKPGTDEVAYYAFDTTLQQVRPFSKKFSSIDNAWSATRAYGATSLWDAVASTAREVATRQQRRALIVITDGVDSASALTPSEVSAIASGLDVPVYMLVITFALENDQQDLTALRGPLADLAAWTGGDALEVRDAESALFATTQILTELQHQYVIAFEPGNAPGWHPLVLRTRKPGLFVRARSGYMVK